MENEFFKAIGLYIDSQYIKVYTKYWVYERGRCSTVPIYPKKNTTISVDGMFYGIF